MENKRLPEVGKTYISDSPNMTVLIHAIENGTIYFNRAKTEIFNGNIDDFFFHFREAPVYIYLQSEESLHFWKSWSFWLGLLLPLNLLLIIICLN